MCFPDRQHAISTPVKHVAAKATSEKLALFAHAQQVKDLSIPEQPAHVYLSILRFTDNDVEPGAYIVQSRRQYPTMTSQMNSSNHWAVEQGQNDDHVPAKRRNRLCGAPQCQKFTTYYHLFTFVIVANLAAFTYINCRLILAVSSKSNIPAVVRGLADILTATSSNLTAAIALRNEHVINLLFRVFVIYVQPSAPLKVRRIIAKVYCFGGIHSGAGLMAALWYSSFTGWTVYNNVQKHIPSSAMERATLALTGFNWFLFFVMVTGAHPAVRNRMHNYFEVSHRLGGWSLLASFWVQTLLFCFVDAAQRDVNFGKVLIRIPTFWMLLLVTGLVIYPWVRAKHNFKIDVEKLSDHAVRLHFKTKSIMPPCRVIRISDNILKETHAFATIPEPDGKPGFSIIVSNAGDWTNGLIRNPPESISLKGSSTWGVLRIATMFDPVVIVTTGSGIGPCLGLFSGCPNLPCRVLWSTRNPQLTYGKEVLDAVRRADPNALIYDSTICGRMDLAQLAYDLYRESQAEAVIVISNKALTYSVVQSLECRGVASFGPIWDS
jgi:hypothetical protein